METEWNGMETVVETNDFLNMLIILLSLILRLSFICKIRLSFRFPLFLLKAGKANDKASDHGNGSYLHNSLIHRIEICN